VILLRPTEIHGRLFYQAVVVDRTGETLKSPLFLKKGEVVRWIMGVLKAHAHSPSPSSKAG
jgi:hypothetical protein